ncbi:MAG: Crp/Fnr family transcriptional regulator [Flavobacteriales bacterium]|nr:Crp/Fnr family transcriptional regulator [Flavobacteriales bacterium]
MEPIPLPDTLAEMIALHCGKSWQDRIKRHRLTQRFDAGQDVFREGDPADQLFIVRKGKVKVFCTYGPDARRILRFARDGQVLGHRGIGAGFTYSVSATALTPTTVDALPMPLFMQVLEANAAFSFHFMLFFAEELRRSEEQTRAMLDLSAEQRVVKALLATLRCFGFDKDDRTLLAFTPSRQDLADYAGTTYESTIRALSALQKKKLIKSVGRELRIVDRGKLESLMRG